SQPGRRTAAPRLQRSRHPQDPRRKPHACLARGRTARQVLKRKGRFELGGTTVLWRVRKAALRASWGPWLVARPSGDAVNPSPSIPQGRHGGLIAAVLSATPPKPAPRAAASQS